MEPSIDNLWFYGVHSSALEFSSAAFKQPPIVPIPSPNPNTNPLCTSAPSCDADDDQSPPVRALHRAFDLIDGDHDGELTGSELCAWMKKLGLKFTEEGMLRLVDLWDTRRCRSLDFKEFLSLNTAVEAEEEKEERRCTEAERNAAHRAVLAEVFELFDKDHNGLISPRDLCDTLKSLGLSQQGDNSQCVDMIKRADLDGDGEVSFSEFETMMDQKPADSHQMDF